MSEKEQTENAAQDLESLRGRLQKCREFGAHFASDREVSSLGYVLDTVLPARLASLPNADSGGGGVIEESRIG